MTEVQMNKRQVGQLSLGGRLRAHCKMPGAITIAVLLAFSGCAKSVSTTTTSTAVIAKTTSTATQKPIGPYGDLRIALSTFGGEVFNPVTATGTTATSIISPMLDFLVGLDGGNVAPRIAEKWQIAPDGLSWTFNIRKGVKFHNGDGLSAKDVKFSLDLYSSRQATYSYLRDLMDRTDIADDYTVRVYTKGTQPWLLAYAGAEASSVYAMVLPKDYIDKNGWDYFNGHPVGSGSFKFVRRVPGDMVEYQALDSHWLQTPAFKNLSVILIPEESTREAVLTTGRVDAIDVGMESARKLERAGFRTPVLSYMSTTVRLYHTYDPLAAKLPTGDIRVRQALSLALDRAEIIKDFFFGKAALAFPPGFTETSRDIDVSYWKSYSAQVYRYDPAEAQRLLKDAGYPNGFSIKMYAYAQSGAPFMPALAEVVQGYWAKIGVRAQLVPIDWGAFAPIRWVGSGANRAANPDVVGQVSIATNSERADSSRNLASNYTSTSSYAAFGKALPELDRLIDAAQREMDSNKRKEYLATAIKMVTDSFAAITICSAPSLAALGPMVDIDFPPMSDVVSAYANIFRHAK